jgi:hypothetical protein
LLAEQFDTQGRCGLKTLFAGRAIEVTYHNPLHLPHGAYQIKSVALDGVAVTFDRVGRAARIDRAVIAAITPDRTHTLDAILGTH